MTKLCLRKPFFRNKLLVIFTQAVLQAVSLTIGFTCFTVGNDDADNMSC